MYNLFDIINKLENNLGKTISCFSYLKINIETTNKF